MASPANRSSPLPFLADAERPILWVRDRPVTVAEFSRNVARVAAALPASGYLVNLCEHRDRFLTAYAAALARGHTSLMPPSRAEEVIAEVEAGFPQSYRCDDGWIDRALGNSPCETLGPPHAPDEQHIAQIAFTSGTTGAPRAHAKSWKQLMGSTRLNAARIREGLEPRYGDARPSIVATVPAQHMYGTELSVLLPLAADMGVHCGRPLFPAEVAAALAEVPAPRVLVTTPVHLRALAESSQRFPEIGLVVSATAPLDRTLAGAIERGLETTLLEMFGSTETAVIATRLTAREEHWRLYPGVTLTPGSASTAADAPWFAAPTTLQDVIELVASDRFVVRGRNVDMIEVAGKRASLSDLTRRILGIPGVRDAVAFQTEGDAGRVKRVAALVVAPQLTVEQIAAQLSRSIDPAFMPRPLVLVPALPRNELGKLSREALLSLAAPHLERHHSN
ncbi:MAG TPA: AMP-binding protein [Steroidobacteraceae bacterium]|nr:AMP-binding protein [Steroidobacteraceae bacterium]